MRYALHCTFAPGAFSGAKRFRLEHYGFLKEARSTIVEGGPLLGPDDLPTGMLIVVECPDAAAARAFIDREPYNANGFFESVAIRRWAHVIPEPIPGSIEAEYRKELDSREAAAKLTP